MRKIKFHKFEDCENQEKSNRLHQFNQKLGFTKSLQMLSTVQTFYRHLENLYRISSEKIFVYKLTVQACEIGLWGWLTSEDKGFWVLFFREE